MAAAQGDGGLRRTGPPTERDAAEYRLYESVGFQAVRTIHLYQGVARGVPLPPMPRDAALRDAGPEDLEVIAALDRAAFGADRGVMLRAIMPEREGVILERAPSRLRARPRVRPRPAVGPAAAPDEASALAVIAR